MTKDIIETRIRDWLNTEFHNPDALPGLVISGLAEEIYKYRWEIYEDVQDEYDTEDVESIEEEKNIKLTKDQKRRAIWRWRKERDTSLDILYDIIDEISQEKIESDDSE